MKLEKILKQFPLRLALTDYCNLKCFFCSNEGMDLSCKNTFHANSKDIFYLLKLLKKNGLHSLSLTGGEPSLYPDLIKVLKFIKKIKFNQTFFHTNGVNLSEDIINNYLSSFSKVAVSIHTVSFDKWQHITHGNKSQFDNLMKNLDLLSKYSTAGKLLVEIKIVPMKNINDSQEDIRQILDYCNKNNFKFKFLNFEPIVAEHQKYQMDVSSIMNKIKKIGGIAMPADQKFRGQNSYLPINWFGYKNIKGVVIEIGCGQKKVCEDCYKSNEIFVSPRFELKPCHANNFYIPLLPLIKKKNDQKILAAIVKSRDFLKTKPGNGANYWNN